MVAVDGAWIDGGVVAVDLCECDKCDDIDVNECLGYGVRVGCLFAGTP